MSEFVPNGYFVDKTGKRIEVTDATARSAAAAAKSVADVAAGSAASAMAKAEENAESITALTEEIEKLKADEDATTSETVKSGQRVTFTPVPETGVKVKNNMAMNAEFPHRNVNVIHHVRSQNIMNFTPFVGQPGTVHEMNGITATVNDDGTLTVVGTNTADSWTNVIYKHFSLEGQGYRVFPPGTYTLADGITVNLVGVNGSWDMIAGNKTGTFTVDRAFFIYTMYIAVAPSATVNKVIPLCMVNGNALPASNDAYDGTIYTATFINPVSNGLFDWQTGELKDTDGNVIETVEGLDPFPALDGLNTIISPYGDATVTYTVYGEGTNSSTDAFDADAWGLPVLRLSGDSSSMSKDNAVDLSYDFRHFGRSGTASVKWQGSSSLSYDEKNYTIKFDTAFEAKEGWGAQKKYCAKADWIDFSHLRNRFNALLWGQICANRGDDPLADCPNYGAIDGFPIIIMINDEFMGVYNFNIPKDAWMSNMGGGAQEVILCADSNSAGCSFKETGTAVLGSDFDVEYITDENSTGWAQTMLNNLINACINSDGSDLDTTIGDMLHWNRAIDYYIFTVLLRGDDMVTKNYLLHKKDNTKILFGAYDMDCTYGLHWNGGSWLNASGGMTFARMAETHRLFELIKTYKTEELKTRYKALRGSVLSEDNILTTFSNEGGKIPAALYTKDNQRWPGKPNTSTNTVHQIADWYRLRCQVIDAEIDAL